MSNQAQRRTPPTVAARAAVKPVSKPASVTPGVPNDVKEQILSTGKAPDPTVNASPLDTDEVNREIAETVTEWVFDDEIGDYVKRDLTQSEIAVVFEPRDNEDPLALGGAYAEGEAAEFDYRWCNADRADLFGEDRKNHFVPVRKSLDDRFKVGDHPVAGSAVMTNELVLCRRPKRYTELRAHEQAVRHAQMTGEKLGSIFSDTDSAKMAAAGFEVFGGMESNFTANRDGVEEGLSLASIARATSGIRPAQAAPNNGRRVFQVNAPFQRDKVAERLGAVGS